MRESVNDISSWPTSAMRRYISELLSTNYHIKQINNNLTQSSIPVNTQLNRRTKRHKPNPTWIQPEISMLSRLVCPVPKPSERPTWTLLIRGSRNISDYYQIITFFSAL